MDAGSRLRVRGEGNVGRRGGETGDLYVFINVREHPAGLRREGTTIHSDVDVSYVDAILGTIVKARCRTLGLRVPGRSVRAPPSTLRWTAPTSTHRGHHRCARHATLSCSSCLLAGSSCMLILMP